MATTFSSTILTEKSLCLAKKETSASELTVMINETEASIQDIKSKQGRLKFAEKFLLDSLEGDLTTRKQALMTTNQEISLLKDQILALQNSMSVVSNLCGE
jgi:hypothetical protein